MIAPIQKKEDQERASKREGEGSLKASSFIADENVISGFQRRTIS